MSIMQNNLNYHWVQTRKTLTLQDSARHTPRLVHQYFDIFKEIEGPYDHLQSHAIKTQVNHVTSNGNIIFHMTVSSVTKLLKCWKTVCKKSHG